MPADAGAAEIVRSYQKDGYYLQYLKSNLADAVQSTLGARHWLRWKLELDMLASAGYLALTTLSGYQTLGEEYVSILQVDRSRHNIPSKLSRGLMILLQVCTPYLLQKLLKLLERRLQSNTWDLGQIHRAFLMKLVAICEDVIPFVNRCHLALFYLQGAYYSVSKRMAGIRYLRVRDPLADLGSSRPSYSILGWLSLVQLTYTAAKSIWNAANTTTITSTEVMKEVDREKDRDGSNKQSSHMELYVSQGTRCSLCLEARKHSTATPCGHLFCWDCILEWCESKLECPLCREVLEPSRLVCLQNFDPT